MWFQLRSPAAALEAREVFAAIAALPDEQREVIAAVDVAGLSYAEAAETLGVPLVGQIPLYPPLREGGDRGTPIVASDPDSAAGRALRDAARRLAQQAKSVVGKPLGLTVRPGAEPAAHAHHH